VTLEQELVRAEAQSLVAEAQLTNVTRQKFKEAYDVHTAAIIERAEKQILLAQQARRLISMLDDTPIVPGEERPVFTEGEAAREVLNDSEANLRSWTPSVQPIQSAGKLGANAMPGNIEHQEVEQRAMQTAERIHGGGEGVQQQQHETTAQPYQTSHSSYQPSGTQVPYQPTGTQVPYPTSESMPEETA